MPLVCQKCGHRGDWYASTSLDNSRIPAGGAPAALQRAALAKIEIEIARFSTYAGRYISALKKQRKEVGIQLKSVVYPVLSIPAEIISLIFVECLNLPSSASTRPSIRRAPLLLMSVCRRWRDIALSTCDLWTSLEIQCLNTSTNQTAVPRGTLHGLTTWFGRAQARPLALILRNFQTAFGPQIQDGAEQLDILDISVILPRLWRLEMELFDREQFRQLIPLDNPLPRLQSFSASLHDTDLAAVLKNAPLLTELCWSRISEDGQPDFRRVASNSLTKLDLSCERPFFSAAEVIGILRNFPSLSDLTCVVDRHDVDYPAPLTFSNLRALRLRRELRFGAHVSLIRTLELLTLPHLCLLECDSSLNPDVVLPFLSRSSCLIHEVKCELTSNSTFAVWRQLGMFPSIDTLDLSLEVPFSRLLHAIDTRSDEDDPSPLILPMLRHITITYHGNAARRSPIIYSDIVDIVNRRCAHQETVELKTVHLVIDEGVDWEWYPGDSVATELRRLMARGLDFTIRVGDGGVVWPD